MKMSSKHIISSVFAKLGFVLLLLCGIVLQSHAQPLVDIGLFPKGADTLEVRLMPKGTFNGVVSNVVFTLRWETGCGSTLGNVVQTGAPAAYIPMAKSGATKTSNGFSYQVFGGLGLQAMSASSATFTNNVAVTLMKIKVNNPKGTYAIVNDNWTSQLNNNGDFFVSLNGQKKNGVIYQASHTYTYTGAVSLCQGDSVFLGGAYRKLAGIYDDTLQGRGGCDSIVRTTVSLIPSITVNRSASICQGASYFAGGAPRTTAGIYRDTLTRVNGCDSIVVTTLSITPNAITNVNIAICSGQSVIAGGDYRTQTGVYHDTLQSQTGCDSIVATHLTVHPTYAITTNTSICQGSALFVGGALQTLSGTYVDTYVSRFGCDSIVTTHLVVELTVHHNRNIAVCNGDGVIAGGAFRTTSGTYYDTLAASFGCDSVIITNLTVKPEFATTVNAAICQGESYYAGGQLRVIPGTYQDMLIASNGCDSVVTTNLIVHPVYTVNRSTEICQGENILLGGALRSASGIYRDTLSSRYGCDSIIVTQLTVHATYLVNANAAICQGESILLGGALRTTSGIYYDTFASRHGCDSIVATLLTVKPHKSSSRDEIVCDGDGVIAGGGFQTTSGTYYDTLVAANGCDSVVATILTVLPEYAVSQNITICQGESYFAGGQMRSTAGTYQDILISAAGCDSVITTVLTVNPILTHSRLVNICQGESFFVGGAARTTTGTYRDTLTSRFNCDSIVITQLKVRPQYLINVNASICQGNQLFVGGAFQTVSGTYYDTLNSHFGCDSVIATHLVVEETVHFIRNIEVCNGEGVTAGGAFQTVSGTYYDTLVTAFGCDSAVITNLTVKPKFAVAVNAAICLGESYFAGGQLRTTAGIFLDTMVASNGCDSVITTNLVVNPVYTVNLAVSICQGESYYAGGLPRAIAGTYQDILSTQHGCDSIINTQLSIKPVYLNTVNVSICAGESFLAGGSLRTTSGIYHDTLTSVLGCDSVIRTNLTVKPHKSFTRNIALCAGDGVVAGGAFQTSAGIYYDTLVASNGCDSVVITDIEVNPKFATTLNVEICAGESYLAAGALQTTSGVYLDTLIATNGCDSVVTTNLTVKQTFGVNVNATICQGENYFAGGQLRTTSGTYQDVFAASNGCDSSVTTNLTVYPVFTTNRSASICQGESYFAGGAPRTVAGIYRDTLTTSRGCDSIIVTQLTVYPVQASQVSATICAGESYLAAGTLQTTSGIYYDTLQTVQGCDSIIATTLTVNQHQSATRNIAVCYGDGILAGGAFQTQTGTYYDTLLAANGCDSVVTTNLTIKPKFNFIVNVEICAGESYFAGGQLQTAAGTYIDSLTASNGCDSVVTTNIVAHPAHFVIQNTTICSGDSLLIADDYQSVSGFYYDTLISSFGCDSIVGVNLRVVPLMISTQTIDACTGDAVFVGGANQTSPGVYHDTLISSGGCDSVLVTNLVFHQADSTIRDILIHHGTSYFVGGDFQTESGTYYDTFTSSAGCDSILVTVLSVENILTDVTVNMIENTVTIRTTLEKSYADNTYGSNAIGWEVNRTLDSLVTSDHLQWALYNKAGAKELDFRVDYLSYDSTGYESMGVHGGEGQVFTGSDSSIISTTTSIHENFNSFGYILTNASPATDTNYTPNPLYPNWIFDVWYQATIKLNTFGTQGYGYHDVLSAHASPDKDDNPAYADADSLIPPSCPRTETKTIIMCEGDSYFIGGAWQTSAGTYRDTLLLPNGCHIYVIANLVLIPASRTNVTVDLCAGESYFVQGALRTQSGIYYDTLRAFNKCDSIITTTLIVHPVTIQTVNVSICSGESYFAGNGQQTTSGMYVDSFLSALGCDSVVITQLSVVPLIEFTRTINACDGDVIFVGGANQTTTGVYYDTFASTAGCDSVVITELFFHQHSTSTVAVQICSGESYYAGGAQQTISGVYYDTLATGTGCDSVVTTSLTVLPVFSTTRKVSICQGESYFVGGANRTTTGTYYDAYVAADGCDSIVATQLTVLTHAITNFNVSICQGEIYFAGGANRTTSGTYQDVLTAANGCDSTVITQLTVLPSFASSRSVSVCHGDSFFAGGAFRYNTGFYMDTVSASNGCDSIIVTNLMVQQAITAIFPVSICAGESYFAGGALRFTSGNYADTLAGTHCDSIVITSLTVLGEQSGVRQVAICSNDSIFAGGGYQHTAGDYYDTVIGHNGCDSVIVTSLTIAPAYTVTAHIQICAGESYFAGGALRTSSGIFIDNYIVQGGCDSVVTTHLTVLPLILDSVAVEICSNETYFAEGDDQNISGIYTDVYTTANGCDSTIVTILTVRPASSRIQTVFICQGDSLYAGNDYRYTAGHYRDTFIAANGCDSILITDLRIRSLQITTQSISACQADSIFTGGSYQTTPGVYYDTFTNRFGCDSILVTNFAVDDTIHINRTLEFCQGESVFIGGAYQTQPGIYFDTFTATGGCDSLITTNLIYGGEVIVEVFDTICAGESVFAGGALQTAGGTYYDTLQLQTGCDTVIVTELTVLPVKTKRINKKICENSQVLIWGVWRNTSGRYPKTFIAENGCDSIVTVDLRVQAIIRDTSRVAICQGERYYAGGALRSTPGTYQDIYEAVGGCDSIVTTILTIKPKYSRYKPVMICNGESYFAGGQMRDRPGIYLDTFSARNGCDSIVLTILNIRQQVATTNQVTVCANESYFAGGALRNTNGVYYDTFAATTGCDSIVTTILTVKPTFISHRSVSICQGESIFLQGANRQNAGAYFDTLTATNGCDSIVITNLSIRSLRYTTRSISICNGESFLAGGAMQTNAGNYSDTLVAANGCDSIVTTQLTVLPVFATTHAVSICNGSSYFAGGGLQTISGTYYDTLNAANGCDSVVATLLWVLPTISTANPVTICQGESYFAAGQNRTVDGTYRDTFALSSGCDSIVSTILTVLQPGISNVDAVICASDWYFINGQYTNTPGTYYDTLVAANGCDSIAIVELSVNSIFSENHTLEICNGDSVFLHGAYRTTGGTYRDTFITQTGCDSIVTTLLVVNTNSLTTQSISICTGESYFAGGAWQTTSGIYIDTLSATAGCDSILITKLTAYRSYHDTQLDTICANESHFAGGAQQTTSGIYFDTLTTMYGCDSIVETRLTVLPVYQITRAFTICSNDSVFAGGDYQSVSGTYYDSLTSGGGCDSIIITSLTVLPAYTASNHVSICAGAGYFAQGALQTTSGIYYDTFIARNGCDSILVTDLQVLPNVSVTLDVSICAYEHYFVQDSFRNAAGTYYDTLWAGNGCDSVVITQLHIIPIISETVYVTICSNESYFAAGTLQTVSGLYYDTLIGSYGCDSIVITDLEVLPVATNHMNVAICGNETYFAQGAARNQPGTYVDTLVAENGCDSILVTDLTVLPVHLTAQFISICAGETYFVAGAHQSQPGQYFDSLSSAHGCDSVIVTNLTVLNTVSTAQTITICDHETHYAGGAAQNTSGTYYDTLVAFNGCDSVVTTHLIVLNSAFTSTATNICAGETYFVAGAYQNQSGIYLDTLVAANGCDSVVQTTLTVHPVYQVNRAESICSNESIYLQGGLRTTPGIYRDTLTTVHGCDSIIITTLTLKPVFISYEYPVICSGAQIFLEGANQTESGTYTDTFTAANGCDSIVITQLTVLTTPATPLTTAICNGDSIYIAGEYRTTAGVYTDTLTSLSGCDSLVATTLTVHALPVADAGNDVTICVGESAQLHVTGGVSFLWNNGMFSPTITVAPTGTQAYSVTVEDGFGCSASDSVTVIVNPLPFVSIIGLNATYCPGDAAVQLTGNPTGGTFSGTAISGNTFSPALLAPGTYTVSYAYTDPNGCSSSTTEQTTIVQLPVATITGLNTAYCLENTEYSLTASPAGGIFSGAGIDTNTFNPSVAGVGIHQITYAATTSEGCVVQTTHNVAVNALSHVTFDIADTILCISEEAIQLNAQPFGGIYSGAGVQNSTFTAALAGAGSHQLNYAYTDSNGCLGTDVAVVTVNNNPAVQIDSISKSFCVSYGDVQFSGVPVNGIFSGPAFNGTLFNTNVAGIGTHQFYYSYTDTFGCTSIDTSHVIVYGEPDITLIGLTPNYCADAAPVILSGYPSGGLFAGQGVVINVFDPEIAGVGGPYPITYRYRDPLGCNTVDTQWVVVNALPEVNLDTLDLTYCIHGSPVTLTANFPGTFSGAGVLDNVFIPAQAGLGQHTLYYAYTDSNNCNANAMATVLVEVCAGISTPGEDEQILVYPNPFKERIHLDVDLKGSSSLHVRLLDVLGRIVLVQDIDVQNGTSTITIESLEMLSPGIYYLEASTGKTKELVKMMKY